MEYFRFWLWTAFLWLYLAEIRLDHIFRCSLNMKKVLSKITMDVEFNLKKKKIWMLYCEKPLFLYPII